MTSPTEYLPNPSARSSGIPELTAEARECAMGDNTPVALAHRFGEEHAKHIAAATALVDAWDANPKSFQLSDMLTVGGSFLPLRNAARENSRAVLAGDAEPKSISELVRETITKDPAFAQALAEHGDKPFELKRSHVQSALASKATSSVQIG